MGSTRCLLIAVALFFLEAGNACAHPVPRDSHDRFISVRLQEGSKPGTVLLSIEYRLEVDELTVVLKDMAPFKDQVDPRLFVKKPLEYYAEYTRIFSDIIGANLAVRVGGQELPLKSGKRTQTLKDEKTKEALGHLRCTFQYSAEFAVKKSGENFLEVRETNFGDQEGQIHFSFVNQAKIVIQRQTIPDADLYKLHPLERPNDFDSKIRTLTIGFVPKESEGGGKKADGEQKKQDAKQRKPDGEQQEEGANGPSRTAPEERTASGPATHDEQHHDHDDAFLRTYRWLRETNAGFWLILLVFAGLGAAHALTPGHGKTLVAAYLVGEHGTFWHALVLGLVTTITHTGVVLIIASILYFLPESMSDKARHAIQTGLGLILGLSVVCLGCWLLLQRLSGRPDHIHLGGAHHHHHHHGHNHNHHDHHHSVAGSSGRPLGLSGIIILGMNGGLIPCWDAVAILAMVAGTNDFWLALPALLAFSAGLAAVLVAIGVLVVQFRNFAGSKWGEGKIVRTLPLVSAIVITSMGMYLCYASLPQNVR